MPSDAETIGHTPERIGGGENAGAVRQRPK